MDSNKIIKLQSNLYLLKGENGESILIFPYRTGQDAQDGHVQVGPQSQGSATGVSSILS